MSVTRVVPKPSVGRDEAEALANDRGWSHHNTIEANEEDPFEEIWLSADGQTGIHWIEDPVVTIPYFLLDGQDQTALGAEIREALPTYGREDLRAMIERSDDWDDFLGALYHVAAAAPPVFDPEFFGWFIRAFVHENATVRTMAAVLSAYPAWPELREPLVHAARSDLDPEVRQVAERMLRHLTSENDASASQ